MKPCILLNLDLQKTEQAQSLTFLQASTPAVLVKVYQDGKLYTGLNGYTATLKFGDDLTPADGWVTVTSASTNPSAGAFLFEFSAAQTNTSGAFKAVVQILDGSGGKFYFGTVSLAIKECTANTGAAELPLGNEVDWSGCSYVNTATAGPYRAGTNITLTDNPDGSVSIAAASASVADGGVTTAKLADLAVTTAKIADGAVTLAKQANLAANSLVGNNTGSAAAPLALTAAQVRAFVGLGDAVWWDSYAMDPIRIGYVGADDYRHPSKPISGLCAKSASSTLQAATLRFAARQAPYGFASYKTTGALEIWYTSDNNDSSNVKITGITVSGSNNMVDWSAVYTDSTSRTPADGHEITLVSIDAASFSSAAIYRFYAVEVSISVRSNYCLAVLNVAVRGQ